MEIITENTIEKWFDEGSAIGAKYMLTCSDNYDYEYYPAYFKTKEEMLEAMALRLDGVGMQSIREVYFLDEGFEGQDTKSFERLSELRREYRQIIKGAFKKENPE